jgi:hypothetical protein
MIMQVFLAVFIFFFDQLHITFRLYRSRYAASKGFCGPNKGLRNKTWAAKMWRSFGVGMERSGMTWRTEDQARYCGRSVNNSVEAKFFLLPIRSLFLS